MCLIGKASNQSSKPQFCKGIIYIKLELSWHSVAFNNPIDGAAHGLKEK